MLIYLLKSTACLLAFLLFYKLVLEKEKMHKFNRFYLLGALALSFGIPLLTFTTIVEVAPVAEVLPKFFAPLEIQESIVKEPTNYLPYILGIVYVLGVLFLLAQFIKNCMQMGTKVRKNQKVQQYNIVHVLLQQAVIPHSFLKYIFLNKTDFENDKIPLEVLLHEEAHVVQKHSLDILFIELLQIVFWFNPLIYLVKHNIKLNHEFLADDAVLHHGVNSSDYGKILLDYSISNTNHQPYFASSINYSSIKKRFSVMKKNTSKKSVWLRSLLLLPLVTALVYGFSSQKTVEVVSDNNQKASTEQKVSQNIEEGATEKMMQEYRKYLQNYQNAKKKVIQMGEYNRIIAIYDLMTSEQKASVIDHKTVIRQLNTALSDTKRKKPTHSQYNSWKNANKFAIWIDNKHVPNSELDNYTTDDFVYFSGSFVYNNARSEKFPQEYQYHLFTEKSFENTYLKAGFNKYNTLLKKYNAEKDAFLKSGKTDNSELRLLHTRLWQLYKQFTPQELKKYNPAKPKPYPYYKTKAEKKSKDSQEAGISSEEMLMQVIRANNTNISNSSLDENQDIVELYREKHKKYQDLTNIKPHYIHKSKKEKEAMEVLFSDLGGMYFRMSKANKVKVKRPRTPHYPYIKFKKDGEIIYKKKEDLTEDDKKLLPPPPPPPPLPPSNNSSPKIVEAKEEFYRMAKIYGKAVQSYTKKEEGNVEELQKTYKEVMDQYNKFKKLSENNYPPPPPPPPPSKKVKIGEKSTIPPPAKKSNKKGPQVDEVIEAQQKATPEQLAEYNKLSKNYNAKPIEKRIYKQRDVKRLKYLYDLMNEEQKKKAEPFPKIAPPPPPPSMDTIYTYNSLSKRTKFIPNNRKNNLQYLKTLFGKMSVSQKNKVESPSSINNYISQLNNLSAAQIKKINEVLNKIKANANSKGRKFYSAAEYKELEELYTGMLNN